MGQTGHRTSDAIASIFCKISMHTINNSIGFLTSTKRIQGLLPIVTIYKKISSINFINYFHTVFIYRSNLYLTFETKFYFNYFLFNIIQALQLFKIAHLYVFIFFT